MICEFFLNQQTFFESVFCRSKVMIEKKVKFVIIRSFQVSLNENNENRENRVYEDNGQYGNTYNKCILNDSSILGKTNSKSKNMSE